MAALRLPHFKFSPSRPIHKPLDGDDADPTQAATSLQSGTFQYVNSGFLTSASKCLSQVSASAIDSNSGYAYLLRRPDPTISGDPNIVILDANGNILQQIVDSGIVTGHSIKLIGSGQSSRVWVADKGSRSLRIYSLDGVYQTSIGPQINASVSFGEVTDVAFDPIIGQYYITDGDIGGPYNRVVVLNTTYSLIAIWGSSSLAASSLQFNVPHAVDIDPWSRVWIVDSQDSRVVVTDTKGDFLNQWKFQSLTLYGISISTARTADNTAMVYLTGNTSGSGPNTGTIMLRETSYDSSVPTNIGSNVPLTAWNNQPGTMLHWICSGLIAAQDMILMSVLSPPQTTPTPASAYQLSASRPLFSVPSTTPAGPVWPTSFHAVALLHPFEKDVADSAFSVAEIWYTESTSMQFDIYDLQNHTISYKYEVVNGSTYLSISINGGAYSTPQLTTKIIPAHDWIVQKTQFQGQLPILDVQTNWWYETVQSTGITNWYWFRSDTNVPWRTMNSDDTNPDNIPVLQDFAFIYWPTFNVVSPASPPKRASAGPQRSSEPISLTSLKNNGSVAQAFAELAKLEKEGRLSKTPEQRAANLNTIQTLIPGISPGDGGLPLPDFPNQFFMTCTMTAINAYNPMSTEVLYDWSHELQRTRMFNYDQASAVDAILTADNSSAARGLEHLSGTTYIITRFADGTFKCGPPIQGIGPVPPNWATLDNAKIIATITNNPQLSPGVTTRIFHCPFDNTTQSQFWVWYSNRYSPDTPVVFMQTLPPPSVGTNLALADYQLMQTTPLIDPVSFSVPTSCK